MYIFLSSEISKIKSMGLTSAEAELHVACTRLYYLSRNGIFDKTASGLQMGFLPLIEVKYLLHYW